MRLLSAVVAATLWATALGAQGQTGPTRPDSTARGDTTTRPVRDSIKTPFPTSPASMLAGDVRVVRYGRDEIFQTGALNVAELVGRITGANVLRSGVALAPQVVTWFGETGRVRVFLDEIELTDLDPRTGRVQDLSAIELSSLESVVIETTPSEVRAHLQTWRVDRTAPETRVDVATGDQGTNLYRAFFGRRFQSGLGFQFSFQKIANRLVRVGGDGDETDLFSRIGWARGDWSVDVMFHSEGRDRNAIARDDDVPSSVPAHAGTETNVFARLGYRSPAQSKVWAQLVAASRSFKEATPVQSLGPEFGTVPADTVDSTATRPQVVLSAGTTLGALKLSVAARYESADSGGLFTPYVRARWDHGPFRSQVFLERNGADSITRAEGSLAYALRQDLSVFGQVSRRSSERADLPETGLFAYGGARLAVRGFTFEGGVVRRDSVVVSAPIVFADAIADVSVPASTGQTFMIARPVYRAVIAEVRGTRWNGAQPYRPPNEIDARLGLDTEWRGRFPRGDFTFRLWLSMYHRGGMIVPTTPDAVVLDPATVYNSNLEIRIKSATISWQYRNFLGADYQTVPGYQMASRFNLYGVRWTFTN